IYVSGYPGTGRMTAVKDFLEVASSDKEVPSDWCYVANFDNEYEPRAIELPPGMGKKFREEMASFVEEAKRVLPEAFEGEEYSSRRDQVVKEATKERNRLFEEINKKAQSEGFTIQSATSGLMVIPLKDDGTPMSEQEFLSLDEDTRKGIQKKREEISEDLRNAMHKLRGIDKQVNEKLKELNKEVALFTIGHLVEDIKQTFSDNEEILDYINAVQNHIVENIFAFIVASKGPEQQIGGHGEQQTPPAIQQAMQQGERIFRKYEVNVVVDNSQTDGAPVIVEYNPTYQNLFGKIEKEAQFGMLTTDFTLIKPGDFHKANGGYLVVAIEDILKNPLSWESLKMAIKQQKAIIEEPAERFGYISVRGIKPQPIPLSIKVVLIGTPYLYQMLYSLDPDFKELFKIKADFDSSMDRTDENLIDYARFVCTFCDKEGLNHMESEALSRLVEYSSRLASLQDKLSTQFAEIADIIREANYYSTQDNANKISADNIEKAINEKIYRSNLIEEKIREMFERGQIILETEGTKVGQANGLSVMSVGDYAFGRPSRVTATVGVGKGGVVDIEREAELGGSSHTKGVLIIGGYLMQNYAQNNPLGISARLVFEQSYGGIDGDSASSTELYTLLSVLSGVPLKQNIAITGSVNQYGEVQPIGGVNEKIEGFFSFCKVKGLTGKQGVMIPASNVQNLMLKEEVIEAVRDGSFHIYAVGTIDEGLEVLTDRKAGIRREDGTFEEGTIHRLVEQKVQNMARNLKDFT
ncbi:MAG TPA: ATP-dependent protease, partial [Methanomicrobia archaeon]|nr:ATP-dependent protease [Methanomicrobia archaeon]